MIVICPNCGGTERRASIWGGMLCVHCFPAMGKATPGAGIYHGYSEQESRQRAAAQRERSSDDEQHHTTKQPARRTTKAAPVVDDEGQGALW